MPTSSEPTIEIDRICKEYRLGELSGSGSFREALVDLVRLRRSEKSTFRALQDVSFEVREGEAVGIIGRNGAGKSTLLKVLSRITTPTSGSIRVRGRLSALLEVGTGFHQDLTGRENIYLNGSILGMTKQEVESRFDEIVEFAEVDRFLDTPIKRYSSGMRLRLGFAVAAHLDAEVLLVDEVLAVGDAAFQKKCLGQMDELRRGARTILFVSHNMAAIETLCSRAIWIDGGRVREDGPASQVIGNYLSSHGGAQGTRQSLRETTDRSGTGAIRFTQIDYLNGAGETTDLIRAGEPLRIQLSYEARERIVEPHFGFEIYSQLGTLITETSTWSANAEVPNIDPGKGALELSIDALNLLPGRYRVSLWISSIGGVDYDLVPYCSTFDVETSDVFAAGRGADQRHGLVFFPSKWRMV